MKKSYLAEDACNVSGKLFQSCRIFALFILFGCFQLLFVNVYSQDTLKENEITGTVIDNNGEPIISASVVVKGTTAGTVTDIDGKYTIKGVPANGTLVFTYLGMKTQSIATKGRSVINVTLQEDAVFMDEVVVVGFGTQKKVNLTGAVAAVKMDEQLTSRSLPNTSLALQGKIAGLAVSQNSGAAGENNVQLLVRGLGTVNNSNPLIVVDGMPDVDLNRLNMDDIESVSVLKDASSSAVYGSRAANGVILVTTKSGKDSKPVINGSASYSMGKPIHAWEFMSDYPRSLTLLQRDAAVNTSSINSRFKNGTIDQWMALGMIDPLRYPNTDWYDVILRDASIQKYNVSATGGSEKSNYYISVGVMDEKGLLMNNDYTQYNARINYDAKIRSNISVGARFAGNWSETQYSSDANLTNTLDANQMRYAVAGVTPYDPTTGYYGGSMAYGEDTQTCNPYSVYTNQLNHKERQEANLNGFLDWKIIKGLSARMDFFLNYNNDFRYQADMPNTGYNFQTDMFTTRVYVAESAPIYNYTNNSYKTQFTGRLNYDFTIAKNHVFNLMAAYNQEYWHTRYLMASRADRVYPTLHEIDAALTTTQTTGGNSSSEGLRSYITRVNYAAYQRYLFEFNLRYDGSSKFLEGHQYGLFPSASVGWVFSEESFINSFTGSWLDRGKFRASYGTLGNNDGVKRYEQIETLKTGNYVVDGKVVKGFYNEKMINRDFTWEETTVMNIGLDLGFLNNRLNAEIDYYDRLTTGMIRPSDFSILLSGAYTPPRKNIGNMRNRGIEANLTWKDEIRDFSYTINGNVAYNMTTLEKWYEYLGIGYTSDNDYVFIDMPYNYVYAYETSGIAQTWEDVYNATPQGARPGDLLYKDLNGDGKIDGNDRKAYPNIQRDRPTTNFALNMSAQWKGFDLALMFQGAAGRKTFWLTANNNSDLSESRQATTWDHWTKPWSLENRDGEWTRLGGANNRRESTFYLDNLAYLRIKNLQVGYTIPKNILQKVGLSSIRVYFSTDNLVTFTKFRGLDPEKLNVSDGYPMMRTFTFGLNVGI